MPAAIPEAERPDEPSTIQTTNKSKITPLSCRCALARRRTLPLVRASAQHDPRRYSPTTFADSLTTFRTKPAHTLSHTQVNDAPQSKPAGQGRLASEQQARGGPLRSPQIQHNPA